MGGAAGGSQTPDFLVCHLCPEVKPTWEGLKIIKKSGRSKSQQDLMDAQSGRKIQGTLQNVWVKNVFIVLVTSY